MRRVVVPLLFLSLVAAKGGKKKDAAAEAPAPAPEVVPAAPAEAPPAAEPAPPAPEAPAPPKVVRNASFSATITYADGTTKGGKLVGVERTADFYGDEGWTEEAGKLKLTVESGSTEKQVAWADVKSISIAPGKIPDEVDCSYSSDTDPWTYECTLRTTASVVLKDGSKGNVSNRHQWRFTWEDTSTTELQVFKYTLREPDDRQIEFGQEVGENFALYSKLQDRIRQDVKTKLVKSITVQ
jgi:hypothetical protein